MVSAIYSVKYVKPALQSSSSLCNYLLLCKTSVKTGVKLVPNQNSTAMKGRTREKAMQNPYISCPS